ncbi:MAG: M23 family metallopeptidase [bacterium]|nr:M23 family metallopeptidase [Candidatus Kapabacteria bacterium]
MKKVFGPSVLVCALATIVAFILPAVNPRAHATLPVDIAANPLAVMADSMRTVTTELDNELFTLVAAASEATSSIESGMIASTEARWIGQRLRELGTELPSLPSVNNDAFTLIDRIAAQQRFIDEVHSLIDQRDALVAHLPTLLPTHGRYSSEFGYRVHPISGAHKMHKGIDIAAASGTPIYSAASGTVIFSGSQRGYGNIVEVDHGFGYVTRYAHASRLLVKVGQTIARGEQIALVGSTGASTGAHLHFEVLVDSVHVDPVAFIAPHITTEPALADVSHDHDHTL